MTPYTPQSLPIETLDLRRLLPLVAQANAELARYDGLLQSILNPLLMLVSLTTQEAVLSSKIEGTQATVGQVFQQEAGIKHSGETERDVVDIVNYRSALQISMEHVENHPIQLNFVRQLHKTLMDGARGRHKSPGEFRKDQNWIGRPGSTIENATFIPPSPLQLQDHLEAWEAYLSSDDLDVLIQTAVMHAQFELLHPFKDGNGRIGRLLIPLFLFQKKMLKRPMFYISEYLERRRGEYYRRLQALSTDEDWDGWIEFFLRAVIEQAQSNSRRTRAIQELYDKMKHRIASITRSQYAIYVLDALFETPAFATSDIAKRVSAACGVSDKTIAAMIRSLRDEGILIEIQESAGQRPAIFEFRALLRIAEGWDD